MVWPTAKVEDEGEEQKANNSDDLDGGKAELGLSINGHSENVQANDDDNDDGNPGRNVDIVGSMPELDDSRSCRDFGAESDGAGIPVVPADSKAHCVVGVTRAKLGNSTGQWQPGGHLAQRHHHGENSETGEGVTEEDGERTRLSEGTANTQEEACADGSAERNELDVSRLQSATCQSQRARMLPRTAVTLASRSHTPRRFVYRHTDRSPHSPSSLFLLPAWTVPPRSDRPRNLAPSPSLGQGADYPPIFYWGGKRRLVEGLRGY